MRLGVVSTSTFIHFDVIAAIDRQWHVRVNCHQEKPRVCVDQIGLIPLVEIMDHTSLVQVRELSHIVSFVELGWVDLVYVLCMFIALTAIIALYSQHAIGQVFDHPAFDECLLLISQPDIALSGEVILALYTADSIPCTV